MTDVDDLTTQIPIGQLAAKLGLAAMSPKRAGRAWRTADSVAASPRGQRRRARGILCVRAQQKSFFLHRTSSEP